MIKIFKSREIVDPSGKVNTPMLPVGVGCESISQLFQNIDNILKKIDTAEQYNLHYTLCDCSEKPVHARDFLYQEVIVFDIDNIFIEDKDQIIPIVLKTLQLRREDVTIVCSGNGLHFIIFLSYVIDDKDFFLTNRIKYNAICKMIDYNLMTGGIKKKEEAKPMTDTLLFAPSRTLRLPNTLNIKRGKDDKKSYFIELNTTPINFSLAEVANIVKVEVQDQISDKALSYVSIQPSAILDGCAFLEWCKNNQNDVTEGQWFAMLSIIGRLPDAEKLAHVYSCEYDGYSESETDMKLESSVNSSGPRTCSNIDTLWHGCKDCKHYGSALTSPILIKDEDYIKSQDTGFWILKTDKNGMPVPYLPDYEGLIKMFNKKYHYRTLEESGIIFIFNGKFWEAMADNRVENFCYSIMNPKPKVQMVKEFLNLIKITNLQPRQFFEGVTGINLFNGWLNLETMVLSEHTVDKGFMYVLPYNYDPSALCPRFDQFMREVTLNRADLEQILIEYAGYCISDIPPEWSEKCLILYGDGANGKSVFLDVLKMAVGRDNYTALTMKDIEDPAYRYSMYGKLVNIAEETPANSLNDSTVFKNLTTGGDTTVKMLYRQPFSVKLNTKLVFGCNKLPSSSDNTRGLYRRLLIAPFDAVFEKEKADKDLRAKLGMEIAGILNRFLAGLKSLKTRGRFSTSVASDLEAEAYIQNNDGVSQWMIECTDQVVVPEGCDTQEGKDFEFVSSLYDSYKQFCDAGNIKPEQINSFGRRIAKLGYVSTTRKLNNRTGRKETMKEGIILLQRAQF